MSAAACKVPINERLGAAIRAFHRLIERPGWARLTEVEQERYSQRAIDIDTPAIKAYEALNDEIANKVD